MGEKHVQKKGGVEKIEKARSSRWRKRDMLIYHGESKQINEKRDILT